MRATLSWPSFFGIHAKAVGLSDVMHKIFRMIHVDQSTIWIEPIVSM